MFVRKVAVVAILGLISSLLTVLLVSNSAMAQRVQLDITKPNVERIPIAIPDFKFQASDQQLAREMGELLASDLDFSGMFRPLDAKGFVGDPQSMGLTQGDIKFEDWKRIGADFLVRAVYQSQGGSLKLEARLFDVVGQRMVIGKIYEGETRNWKGMVHRFADEILYALTGERGMFDTKIAYVQSDGKNKEIYIADFDGGNAVQFTRDHTLALSPSWNSQGNALAYVSYKDGNAKIFSLNLSDGSQRLLCGFPGINISPAWRPGTSELAVTLSKDGTPDIYLINSGGQVLQRLIHGWAISVSPSWSPDGRKLAYVSDETGHPQVYVFDVGTGSKKRITFSGNYNTSPSWSPKGDYIAYSGIAEGHHNIFTIKPDGSDNKQLTHGEGNNESPTWSPDGRMIAFSSTRQGGSAIWVLWTNGSGARRITRGGGQELPRWSPHLGGR